MSSPGFSAAQAMKRSAHSNRQSIPALVRSAEVEVIEEDGVGHVECEHGDEQAEEAPPRPARPRREEAQEDGHEGERQEEGLGHGCGTPRSRPGAAPTRNASIRRAPMGPPDSS